MNALPSPIQIRVRYGVDLLGIIRGLLTCLHRGALQHCELKEIAPLLKGDLMESLLFKRLQEWLEAQAAELNGAVFVMPERLVRVQILRQISLELTRRGLSSKIALLAKVTSA